MRLLAQSTDRPLEPYPDVLPPLEYPEHFEVRKVSTNGGIRWHSRWINISSALGNEFIALEPIGPALWQLYFGPTTLGWCHPPQSSQRTSDLVRWWRRLGRYHSWRLSNASGSGLQRRKGGSSPCVVLSMTTPTRPSN